MIRGPGPLQSEARFTKPTALCPRPDLWLSADGDSTEYQVAILIYGLIIGLQPEYCVETGTAYGETAVEIGKALFTNKHGKLVTIEIDAGRAEYSRHRVEAWSDYVEVVTGNSLAWTPEAVIDFAWFDSSRILAERLQEFERYQEHMRRGTIVGFHDTAPGHGGNPIFPGSDFRSLLSSRLRGKVRLVHLPTPRGLTIGEVL